MPALINLAHKAGQILKPLYVYKKLLLKKANISALIG